MTIEPAIQLRMLGTGSAQIEAACAPRDNSVSGNRYIRVRNLFDESKFLDLRQGRPNAIRPLRKQASAPWAVLS